MLEIFQKSLLIVAFVISTSLSEGSSVCSKPAANRGFIFGTVTGVQGQNAIVKLPAGSTCANSFYMCGDMRKANTSGRDEFFGIIKTMTDNGNGTFSVYNDCPLNWPPKIGTLVFLYYKSCSKNSCPGPEGPQEIPGSSMPCVD